MGYMRDIQQMCSQQIKELKKELGSMRKLQEKNTEQMNKDFSDQFKYMQRQLQVGIVNSLEHTLNQQHNHLQ